MNIYHKVLFAWVIIRFFLQIIREALSDEKSEDKLAGIIAATIVNLSMAYLIYKSYQ